MNNLRLANAASNLSDAFNSLAQSFERAQKLFRVMASFGYYHTVVTPHRHNRTRKKQRLTRLQRRYKRQK